MNQNRLGCLSPLALLGAGFTLLLILFFAWSGGNALFSPGGLNAQPGQSLGGVTSHASLAENCAACHPAYWQAETMSERCLVCHTNIQADWTNPQSLHGVILSRTPAPECRACHPEHRGAEAPLTLLTEIDFPHEVVGFSLARHTRQANSSLFACADCHPSGIASFSISTCAECHTGLDAVFMQSHQSQFGEACLACHDGADRYGDFSHSQTDFPLTGKHTPLECSSCHAGARTPQQLQETPLACESCHASADPHEGRYGNACGVCHSPEGWQTTIFDHSLASFPLEGSHTQVACQDCHQNGVYLGTPTDCYSCHREQDEHNGQYGAQCQDCHNTTSWEDATFDHNLSNFPLTGAHTSVLCADCHQNGVFAGTAAECYACHAEPAFHAGLFGSACADCHTTTAWSPAQYNGAHTFPLGHGGGTTCATCHPSGFVSYTCYGCHEHDPASVRSEHLEEGISNFENCVSCHPTGQEDEAEGGGDDD